MPKERFILNPGAEREEDPSLVLGWAGWDHAQQGASPARYDLDRRDLDGWGRVAPGAAPGGLLEPRPWLFQWHGQPDPETGENVAASYAGFLDDELRALGLTEERPCGLAVAACALLRETGDSARPLRYTPGESAPESGANQESP